MVDLRNHGLSGRHPVIDYTSLANDIHAYMADKGIESSTLVGHSLGAKTAMAFSCMYPNMVNRLVSLDASPIDRMNYPHLNQSSQEMIENAMALGSLEGMSLENAIKKIKNEVEDQVLQTALLFNLNPDCTL